MAEAYALHEGAFGLAVVLELRGNLVPHAHPDTQIAFWLGGAQAEARIGSEVVRYSEQVALAANAYESHDVTLLEDSAPAVFLAFEISKPWLDQRRQVTGRRFLFPSPRVPIDPALRQSCWRVLDMMLSAHEPRAAIDDEVERLLIAAIDASTALTQGEQRPVLAPVLDHRLRKAIAYMREHVCDKSPVEEVAGQVGLSRAQFFALFRDHLNTTPQVFWSAVRVEEAIRRLVQEGEPLTDVAFDLGFSAPGNFSRFFKEHTGVSPSTYRRAAGASVPQTVTGLPR
jgi:AraC-like DNA-binding protein